MGVSGAGLGAIGRAKRWEATPPTRDWWLAGARRQRLWRQSGHEFTLVGGVSLTKRELIGLALVYVGCALVCVRILFSILRGSLSLFVEVLDAAEIFSGRTSFSWTPPRNVLLNFVVWVCLGCSVVVISDDLFLYCRDGYLDSYLFFFPIRKF